MIASAALRKVVKTFKVFIRTRFAANFCSSLYSEFSQAFHFSAAVLGLLDGSARGGMARQCLKDNNQDAIVWYVRLQHVQEDLDGGHGLGA